MNVFHVADIANHFAFFHQNKDCIELTVALCYFDNTCQANISVTSKFGLNLFVRAKTGQILVKSQIKTNFSIVGLVCQMLPFF